MKTTKTISMQQFASEVKKLAEQIGQNYYNVRCSIIHFIDRPQKFEFDCYIHTKAWVSGVTPNEALQKMKELCDQNMGSPIKEIEIAEEYAEYHLGAQQ